MRMKLGESGLKKALGAGPGRGGERVSWVESRNMNGRQKLRNENGHHHSIDIQPRLQPNRIC